MPPRRRAAGVVVDGEGLGEMATDIEVTEQRGPAMPARLLVPVAATPTGPAGSELLDGRDEALPHQVERPQRADPGDLPCTTLKPAQRASQLVDRLFDPLAVRAEAERDLDRLLDLVVVTALALACSRSTSSLWASSADRTSRRSPVVGDEPKGLPLA